MTNSVQTIPGVAVFTPGIPVEIQDAASAEAFADALNSLVLTDQMPINISENQTSSLASVAVPSLASVAVPSLASVAVPSITSVAVPSVTVMQEDTLSDKDGRVANAEDDLLSEMPDIPLYLLPAISLPPPRPTVQAREKTEEISLLQGPAETGRREAIDSAGELHFVFQGTESDAPEGQGQRAQPPDQPQADVADVVPVLIGAVGSHEFGQAIPTGASSAALDLTASPSGEFLTPAEPAVTRLKGQVAATKTSHVAFDEPTIDKTDRFHVQSEAAGRRQFVPIAEPAGNQSAGGTISPPAALAPIQLHGQAAQNAPILGLPASFVAVREPVPSTTTPTLSMPAAPTAVETSRPHASEKSVLPAADGPVVNMADPDAFLPSESDGLWSRTFTMPQADYGFPLVVTSQTDTRQIAASVPVVRLPQAILAAVRSNEAQPVSLQLDPIELGTVSFNMDTGPTGLVVTIVAERPETLELLRRHADQFLADLRQSGFQGASLQFGSSGQGQFGQSQFNQGQHGQPQLQAQSGADYDVTKPMHDAPSHAPRATPSGGLNLRL